MTDSISGGKTPYRHEDFKKAKDNPAQPKEKDEGEKMKFVKEKLKHRVIDDYKPKAPIQASRLIDTNDYRPNAASLKIRPGPSELKLPTAESSKKPLTNSNRPLPNLRSNVEEKVITNKPKRTNSTKPEMPHLRELKDSEVMKRRREITDAGEKK